jgi:hypothetical protein
MKTRKRICMIALLMLLPFTAIAQEHVKQLFRNMFQTSHFDSIMETNSIIGEFGKGSIKTKIQQRADLEKIKQAFEADKGLGKVFICCLLDKPTTQDKTWKISYKTVAGKEEETFTLGVAPYLNYYLMIVGDGSEQKTWAVGWCTTPEGGIEGTILYVKGSDLSVVSSGNQDYQRKYEMTKDIMNNSFMRAREYEARAISTNNMREREDFKKIANACRKKGERYEQKMLNNDFSKDPNNSDCLKTFGELQSIYANVILINNMKDKQNTEMFASNLMKKMVCLFQEWSEVDDSNAYMCIEALSKLKIMISKNVDFSTDLKNVQTSLLDIAIRYAENTLPTQQK